MDLEEEREDVAVGRRARVEHDLHGLGVSGVVAIGRVVVLAAGVAHAGVDDPGLAADEVFHAPEAAAGEDGRLGPGSAGDGSGVGHDCSSEVWVVKRGL
ncbi:Uncharacterised protein [Mycobacterium tuberculosis]|nr:Uncharacterised protein [Mycobacterium tuberculosis]